MTGDVSGAVGLATNFAITYKAIDTVSKTVKKGYSGSSKKKSKVKDIW